MKTLLKELFDFDSEPTRGEVIHFRLLELFIVGFTVHFCWTWGYHIQTIEEVLLPLGIAQYVDISFMFDHQLSVINAGVITVLAALGFFRVWRPAYLVALLLFHVQYVARYCLGEISHGSNFIGMSLLALALGAVLFAERWRGRRFTMGFLYFFIGLGYTSAACSKLIGTGLTWADGQHLWMWIAERQVDTISKVGAFEPNVLQQLILEHVEVGTVVLAFGLLAELSGFLMWWRRFRYLVIPILISMHVGIGLTMSIWFDVYIYQLLLLGAPWPRLIDWLEDRARSLLARPSTKSWRSA